MSTELEQLRRRLYGPDAAADDLAAYRRALGEQPPAPDAVLDVPRPRRRRPRAALAAGLAVAVAAAAALIAGTVGTAQRPVAAPTATPVGEVTAPPIVRTSSAAGLTEEVAVQRLIDRVFADQGGGSSSNPQDALDGRVRRALLPAASSSTGLASAGGSSDDGAPVAMDLRGVLARPDDVLLLSAATRDPSGIAWRLLGWRVGEPRRPHPLLEVQPPAGRADRLGAVAVRVPELMTLTGLEARATPRVPFSYRLELQDRSVCRPSVGPGCDPGWRGTRD